VRNPVLGGGAGSFRFDYLRSRHSPESPEDPHSAEMLMLSELGIPGLALFVTIVVAIGAGIVRARRMGAAQAAICAAAGAGVVYWLVHASYDWFWSYAALTAGAFYLAGVAVSPAIAAPTMADQRRTSYSRFRVGGAVICVVAILIAVPIYLADRYTALALDQARSDPSSAIANAGRAASLAPLDAEPLLVKGLIEAQDHRPAQALSSFEQARGRQPDNYATDYFIARLLLRRDPNAARAALSRAFELNPNDPQLKALRAKLAQSSAAGM
jgi:tetratricopeptide (TPR) repeat protein